VGGLGAILTTVAGIAIGGQCESAGTVVLQIGHPRIAVPVDANGTVYSNGSFGQYFVTASAVVFLRDAQQVAFDGVVRNEVTGAFVHIDYQGTFGSPCTFTLVSTPGS
jgi:hypothetical protein